MRVIVFGGEPFTVIVLEGCATVTYELLRAVYM